MRSASLCAALSVSRSEMRMRAMKRALEMAAAQRCAARDLRARTIWG